MPDRAVFRLSFYFGALFAVVGVIMPYWPVYLESRGLTPTQIGLVLSSALWVKVIANPMIAQWADRRGERRRPMLLLCLVALAAYASFAFVDGFPGILFAGLFAGVAFAAIMPLGENVVLTVTYERGLDYGRLRLWGSLTFIVTAQAAGSLLLPFGAEFILWAVLALVLLALAACAALPDVRPPQAERGQAPLLRLLLQPTFGLFLIAASLIQASHAVLYGFGTLHWRAIGISDGMIGWLWAEGVIAEVVLFAVSGWLVTRVGVAGLLALGAGAGLIRWLAFGLSGDLSVLVVMQVLHAFTFGATHLGAMHFIARAAPPAWSASAQSMYTAVSGGIAMGGGTWLAGLLYQQAGAQAFFASAAMSAGGLLLSLILARRWNGGRLAT
jgi:PPP family 3-phenylpropionic acid transporter